ncbi:hypothetical protein GLOIN_2v1486131 [Rhizophagus irregularis DAOM 181602=DAOM 197198]|uniref:Uncharacterized protein n=1 Tax=Rhizophagus irregularis (strain DAOM 181602 / DAOM 197198 / MUCL 43194) TaxID=747089 RepID=A0A2P4P838_RHIID|nr:hypothetical protein GLOIN_2v1486131 [Rhizophagus irregularis DAOM 181602=DAOM 197198]POG61555.1 hypothetical protein GLOIN_2v1486131 [Rhizophagus irregularis DAOM 181602=DAOM 197198]|eukprot:XP_025168421.1 hypothetical protein GLOIN_2v1486131 [Rhizophagus irregularis DAOM 181602=DAOM 197198]
MLAKFTKTDINVRFYNSGQIYIRFYNSGQICKRTFYNSGQILLGEIILIPAKLMCNLEKNFAFFIVTRWFFQVFLEVTFCFSDFSRYWILFVLCFLGRSPKSLDMKFWFWRFFLEMEVAIKD